MKCPAPWYEMFVSATENKIGTCCYYTGDTLRLDEAATTPLNELWNDGRVAAVRRLQGSNPPPGENGCSQCHFFTDRPDRSEAAYFDFKTALATDLSPAQRANIERAQASFLAGEDQTTSLPLRYFLLFGASCNIDCVMCIQSPGRGPGSRPELSWELLQSWWPSFKSAVSVDVIGGEPLVIPSATRFLRAFVADPELDSVRLNLFTNAAVLHKAIPWLEGKRRLGFAVSLDSIGTGYETIRKGGRWSQVAENLKAIRTRIETSHPEWTLTTNALIMKTALPYLPEFARFHVENRIPCVFHGMVNVRGVEEVCFREDVLSYPHVLDDMPHWRGYFEEAVAIYASAGTTFANEQTQLDLFRRRIEERLAVTPGWPENTGGCLVSAMVGDEVTAAITRTTGYNNAPLESAPDGAVSFAATHNHQAHYLRLEMPKPTLLKLRLIWNGKHFAPKTCPCAVIIEDQIDVELLSWTERTDPVTGLNKEALLRCHGADVEIALKTGRKGMSNLLPDRIEVVIPHV